MLYLEDYLESKRFLAISMKTCARDLAFSTSLLSQMLANIQTRM